MPGFSADPTFDWPSVFKPGDVVRSRDTELIGVILEVENYSPHGKARYELKVDGARGKVLEGPSTWEPWEAILANDPESRAEAKRLGLSGLDGA